MKTVKEILEIVDKEEERLRTLDKVITIGYDGKPIDLKLSKKNIKEFIKDFFYWNNIWAYESESYKSTLTSIRLYHTLQQKSNSSEEAYKCRLSARRSIGDLFRLARNYYSDKVSLLEIMRALFEIVQKEEVIKVRSPLSKDANNGYLYQSVCSTVRRRVFTPYQGSPRTEYGFSNNEGYQYLTDEFRILAEDYRSLFSTPEGIAEVTKALSGINPVIVKPDIAMDELDRLIAEKLAAKKAILKKRATVAK